MWMQQPVSLELRLDVALAQLHQPSNHWMWPVASLVFPLLNWTVKNILIEHKSITTNVAR